MDQRLPRKPTISDVARWAGISTATVSRTLATPEKVTARTRAIVLEAVRKIGYVPNLAARNLRTNKTRTILAVLPDFSNVFFSRSFGLRARTNRKASAIRFLGSATEIITRSASFLAASM